MNTYKKEIRQLTKDINHFISAHSQNHFISEKMLNVKESRKDVINLILSTGIMNPAASSLIERINML